MNFDTYRQKEAGRETILKKHSLPSEFWYSGSTLQMFTGIYGVPVDFFCNIYGKGL